MFYSHTSIKGRFHCLSLESNTYMILDDDDDDDDMMMMAMKIDDR